MSEKKLNFVEEEIKSNNPKSQFVIKVAYEHGDADQTTYSNMKLKDDDFNYSSLEKWINKFEEARTVIDNIRSYGADVPEEYDGVDCILVDDVDARVFIEYDIFAEGISNYYADMAIDKITKYDENGKAFKVNFS